MRLINLTVCSSISSMILVVLLCKRCKPKSKESRSSVPSAWCSLPYRYQLPADAIFPPRRFQLRKRSERPESAPNGAHQADQCSHIGDHCQKAGAFLQFWNDYQACLRQPNFWMVRKSTVSLSATRRNPAPTTLGSARLGADSQSARAFL